jgi:hypothetical protein
MNMRETKRSGNRAFLIFLVITAVYLLIGDYQAKAEEQDPIVTNTLSPITTPVAFLIDNDQGGYMGSYERTAGLMAGTKVIIDGSCMSACTMFLRTDYQLDLCITSKAMFGFHMPYSFEPGTRTPVVNASAAKRMYETWVAEFYDRMPAGVQKALEGKHIPAAATGEDPGLFQTVLAASLIGEIPLCEPEWQSKYTLLPRPTTNYLEPQ